MLRDQDRVFTNLYGFDPPSLAAARARGDWDGTKEILARGRDALTNEVRESGLRGRGGAGLLARMQAFQSGPVAGATVMPLLMQGYDTAQMQALAQWFARPQDARP